MIFKVTYSWIPQGGVDKENAEKQGYLKKEGIPSGIVAARYLFSTGYNWKSIQRRWFVLKDEWLYYYTDHSVLSLLYYCNDLTFIAGQGPSGWHQFERRSAQVQSQWSQKEISFYFIVIIFLLLIVWLALESKSLLPDKASRRTRSTPTEHTTCLRTLPKTATTGHHLLIVP